MRKGQEQVKEFMQKFGQPTPDKFTELSPERRLLRAKLILEEALETIAALGVHVACESGDSLHDQGSLLWDDAGAPNWPEVIDGLCDLKYVTNVCAVEMGVDLEPFEEEVHASNMEKTGGATREDGKILKPRGWRPPEIALLLEMQKEGWAVRDGTDFAAPPPHSRVRPAIWRSALNRREWYADRFGGVPAKSLAEIREYVRREFGV